MLAENEISNLSHVVNRMCLNSPKYKPEYFKSNKKKLAFWINLYNAIVLNEVVTHYPVKSIQNIRNIWKKKHHLAGLKLSLDEIEHDFIRKFNDPRTHFAIICGAYSCPKLQRFVFTGELLDNQLESVEKEFYNNPINFQINVDKAQIKVSELFFWYAEDFSIDTKFSKKMTETEQKTSILKYLKTKTPDHIRNQIILINNLEIIKMPWHWQLNEARL